MISPDKPSDNEQEYFVRRDLELMAEMRAKLDAERTAAAARRCPVDGTTLAPQTFHDVVIDVCPTCKGTWLDAGELEQLLKAGSEQSGGVMRAVLGLFRKK